MRPNSICFFVFALFLIESGISEDNGIDSDEKIKKLTVSKKDTKMKKKLLDKAKAKKLKVETTITTVITTPISTTTQGTTEALDVGAPKEINWRDKLRTHLLTPYKKDVHPVRNHFDTVRVDL